MNHRKRVLAAAALAATVALAAGTFAQTQVPDPFLSSAASLGGWITICPAGDGETLASAGATITVTLIDGFGSPVVGYPKEDIRVESANPGDLVFCPDGNIADADTDANGVTTFSGTLVGGGCTQGGLMVTVGGAALASPALAIDVNSPDLNGDLRVDLCDFIPVADNYFGGYLFCADYNHDFALNLPDLGILAAHYCAVCPAGTPPTVTLSGEIGVFFDAAGTQTGILGIPVATFFEVYVVALSAPGDIRAYQFGLTYDESNMILMETVMPVGSIDMGGSTPATTVVAPLGGCLQVSGPTVLARYQAMIFAELTESPICLGPPEMFRCDFVPAGPAYISCLDDCGWRQFNPAYAGCAYVNGMGPVAVETTSWGRLKATFRR